MTVRPVSYVRASALLVICQCLAVPSLAVSSDVPVQPYQLVRSLSVEQNRIVHGDRAAFETLQTRLVETSNALLSADKAVWIDNPRNARAVIKLVLSGGPPDVLKKLVEANLLVEPYLTLATATVAFAEGRKAEAHKYFKEIDPRKLEPSLGGHVALVKALITGAGNTDEAYAHLDEACLLSPGTIVEEAALRRHAPAAAMKGDIKRFEALASRYLRRFPNSLYSEGFLSQIGVTIAEHDYGSSPLRAKFFEKVLSLIAIDKQHALLSTVVTESLALGHIATAKLALEKMWALPSAGIADAEVMRVYEAATLILTDDFEAGVAALASVANVHLKKRERELAEAANRLIESIRGNAEVPEASTGQPHAPVSTQTSRATVEGLAENEALRSSRKTLDTVDKYLAELDS